MLKPDWPDILALVPPCASVLDKTQRRRSIRLLLQEFHFTYKGKVKYKGVSLLTDGILFHKTYQDDFIWLENGGMGK